MNPILPKSPVSFAHMLIWPYAICPCAHMVQILSLYAHIIIWSGPYDYLRGPTHSTLKPHTYLLTCLPYHTWELPIFPDSFKSPFNAFIDAFMHAILYYTILYLWEYAMCPYGPGHMPYAHMVIYLYICPWELQ